MGGTTHWSPGGDLHRGHLDHCEKRDCVARRQKVLATAPSRK